MSSTDFELDDNFGDDEVGFDESTGKLSAKESLEKRRLIDELLAQRRLDRELKDYDYDFDDDEEDE
ncbi:PA3496 family putative envelope integrity protein [Acinetobacter rudis]|uniref:Acidic transcription factor A n=1 Tax=Acinetobacter rudis TaxID=632955 RepID=A0AAW8J4F7_9GAMM|nr:hypothetical protein [Acinetobacter rudis]MDQ8934580.1 hypothetical protein [Acinetobacter rudis]MDQ8951653.1 hypothetical protein [Acinetobacter rudis]MDQ9016850.1 hypothetical protein [Acinetobacter rudis]